MSKLRITYVGLLVILAILVGFTIFRPITTGEQYSNVARWHLLETENEYIIELDIINHEGEEKMYSIRTLIDGKLYREDALIHDGRTFTYIHHIRTNNLTDGNVHFAIYKDGEDTPFKKANFYLKRKGAE